MRGDALPSGGAPATPTATPAASPPAAAPENPLSQ
jgi:phage shock protein A